MYFNAGDTFINKSAPHTPTHLWIIISDPKQSIEEIVIVNLTTFNDNIGSDTTCILDNGDHPFIKHKTYVNYRDAKCVTLEQLQKLEAQKLITRRESLMEKILEKIREGVMDSPFIPLKIRKILEDQNLI